MSDDLFDAVMRGAREDGALGPERLEAFARGLRERALKILEERIAPLEARAGALEREAEWRKATEEKLTAEIGWLREQVEHGRSTLAALEGEAGNAAKAHDRLLEHHRHVVSEVLAALESFTSGPAWPREETARLAEALKKELG